MPDFRVIPSIEQLRQRALIAALETQHGQRATRDALRAAADAVRARIAAGARYENSDAAARDIEARVGTQLAVDSRGSLRSIINATGIVVHTNLGRAPLAAAALARVVDVAGKYSNLEYDVTAGKRGSRSVHAAALLTALTGAEAALVVNNNAAATMLILAALGAGREVIISRGELVEIGGGFRVPDVMAQSGAILREVGTTNRTRVSDYRAAIGPRTALLLRVHPSNFRIEGFTERPTLDDLVSTAREASIPLVEDLGSGSLLDAFTWEPTVQASIRAGADLVCFSGDKMLGGPQAGLIVGRRASIEQLQRHPLMRAMRVDKLTIAALEGTLLEYRAGRAATTVPVARMLSVSPEAIAGRAARLAGRMQEMGWLASLVRGESAVGGGSAPGIALPTTLVAVRHPHLSADTLETRLRQCDPPVIARIDADHVVFDLRTVFDEQDAELADILRAISQGIHE